jgi:hypothetical protein
MSSDAELAALAALPQQYLSQGDFLWFLSQLIMCVESIIWRAPHGNHHTSFGT